MGITEVLRLRIESTCLVEHPTKCTQTQLRPMFERVCCQELRKLAVKFDVADQAAKDARSRGRATTGAMMPGRL